MNLDASTLWWLLVGLAVLLELFTGTFYLLMLAMGLAAGAVAAHLGLAAQGQVLCAGLVGAVVMALCYFYKKRRPGAPSARADRSVNLDVGSTVQVSDWNLEAGTAQVSYRGARWEAIHRPGVTPVAGPHRVVELVGNRLLVEPV